MSSDQTPPPVPDAGGADGSVPGRRAPDGGPYNPPPPVGDGLPELQVRIGRAERAHAALVETVGQLGPGLDALRSDTENAFAEARRVTDQALEDGFRTVDATLEEHQTAIQRILRRQEANRNQPVNWPALTAVQAARHWTRLADWIDEVFVPWGEITRDMLPDCWALHRPVVVQLSWLRSAHVQAYIPVSEPSVAGDWHIRWSPAVLEKIKTVIDSKYCRPGEHMITVEESNARRRAAAQTNPPPTARAGAGAGRTENLGRMQLAEREYWQAFLIQARDQDLAWRRARDEQNHTHDQQAAEPGTDNPDLEPPPDDED